MTPAPSRIMPRPICSSGKVVLPVRGSCRGITTPPTSVGGTTGGVTTGGVMTSGATTGGVTTGGVTTGGVTTGGVTGGTTGGLMMTGPGPPAARVVNPQAALLCWWPPALNTTV